MISTLFIIGGLLLLVLGGNWLLKAAVALSLKLNMSKMIIGMTVVSFATSLPELIVSSKAAIDGLPAIALGNVVGSNIANLGLVLGIIILLRPIGVKRSFYTTDWPVMMAASLLLCFFLISDNLLERSEGFILFAFLLAFLVFLLRFQKQAVVEEEIDEKVYPLYKIALFLGLGGAALWGGSTLLIDGAVALAQLFEVSEKIIAITVVSIGTSVPELAASIIAIIKKEKAISLGNLIGSNVFNILAVLGITVLITPIQTASNSFNTELYWMLGISFLILPLILLPKRMSLSWHSGVILLISYVVFVFMTIDNSEKQETNTELQKEYSDQVSLLCN